MLAGPLFSREALTAPRTLKLYLMRSGYVAALFLLMYTASQATFGWQQARNVGDIARFGALAFQVFSLVQLSLVMFFALLFAAGAVAQEKDRRTLVLLLMTDLRSRELVFGKLTASLLIVAVLLAASIPVFLMLMLLGGVSLEQIGWSLGICASAALAAGTWGCLVAYWREKTFQTLAISVLGMVLFIGAVEAVIAIAGSTSPAGQAAALLNPYRALLAVLDPLSRQTALGPVHVSALPAVASLLGLAVVLSSITIARLRVWNPPQAIHEGAKPVADQDAAARARTRDVWTNPIIWREICTRAYGRKIVFIKLAYLAIVAAVAYYLVQGGAAEGGMVMGMVSPWGAAFVGLSLLSLMLINAQAVTAFTSERDAQTLELLLVTEVTAKEFVFGKLGGILYNTKEVVLVPLLLAGWFVYHGSVSVEQFIYLAVGYAVLVAFAAMLGLHSGLSYDNSRSAIATSLGTMFFLFIGIFIFMLLLVEARGSFFLQFQSFIVFIGVGSIGLYVSLRYKNPSLALSLAAFTLPFLTFYGITEYLLAGTLGVCLSISLAYGFATIAMLIPAVSEFDVALGRTTVDKG